MEHKKRLIVLDGTGSRETEMPASVELRPGEEVQFEGKTYTVEPSRHAMSDDAEVMTTTHIIKTSETVASV